MKLNVKAKHKLIPSIAMLVISAVVLSTASYAWFTMSRTVTADGISLTAVAPTNLLISSKADADFDETTTLTSIANATLIPASTTQGLNFFAPREVKKPAKDDASGLQTGAPIASTVFDDVSNGLITADKTEGYYADFKLYLKTTGTTDVDVTVSQINTLIAKSVSSAVPDITNAVRFAILNGSGNALIDSKPAIYSLTDGTVKAQTLFKNVAGPVKAAGAGVFAGDAAAERLVNDKTKIFTCQGAEADGTEHVYPITVRVWIEGQAAACISDNAKAQFNLTVGFTDVNYTEGINGATTPTTPTNP